MFEDRTESVESMESESRFQVKEKVKADKPVFLHEKSEKPVFLQEKKPVFLQEKKNEGPVFLQQKDDDFVELQKQKESIVKRNPPPAKQEYQIEGKIDPSESSGKEVSSDDDYDDDFEEVHKEFRQPFGSTSGKPFHMQ